MIHPSAQIHPNAQLADNVHIGPFCIIEDACTIEADVQLDSHVVLKKGTHLGAGSHLHAFCVTGDQPQDLTFDAAISSYVRIGKHSVIREGVTIHRATQPNQTTSIGDHCLLMANSHIGHDCIVGNHVILANGALLAGHCQIDDHAFISGNCLIHQFTRIGEGVMMSGGASTGLDAAPFLILEGRNQFAGLNLIGMKRRGFSAKTIQSIKTCFNYLFGPEGGNPRSRAETAIKQGLGNTPEAERFLRFFLCDTQRKYLQARHLRRR